MIYSYKDGIKTTICSSDELTELVHNTVKYYEEKVEELIKRNKQLYTDAEFTVRKDYEKQIASLEEKLQLSYGEFSSQRELDAYNKFVNEHLIEREEHKCNGGRVPYVIPNHTGIGTIFKVKCPICGEEKDITDSEAW